MKYTSNLVRETIKCRRYCASAYIDGHFITQGYSEFEFAASVQPINESTINEIQGERTSGNIKIITYFLLLRGDIIIYNNNNYKVMSIKYWSKLPFHKDYVTAIASRIDAL